MARPLGPLRLLTLASPAYLTAHGCPQTPDDPTRTGRWCVYPSRKQLPARVRTWVDFVIEQFAGHPDLSVNPAVWAA